MSWLMANLSTIIICIILAVTVFLIIRGLHRNKKAGKSSCGGGCQGCPMSGSCHK